MTNDNTGIQRVESRAGETLQGELYRKETSTKKKKKMVTLTNKYVAKRERERHVGEDRKESHFK